VLSPGVTTPRPFLQLVTQRARGVYSVARYRTFGGTVPWADGYPGGVPAPLSLGRLRPAPVADARIMQDGCMSSVPPKWTPNYK